MSNPSLDTFKRHRDGDYVLVFSSRKTRALKSVNSSPRLKRLKDLQDLKNSVNPVLSWRSIFFFKLMHKSRLKMFENFTNQHAISGLGQEFYP
jgi:hypothetical protein